MNIKGWQHIVLEKFHTHICIKEIIFYRDVRVNPNFEQRDSSLPYGKDPGGKFKFIRGKQWILQPEIQQINRKWYFRRICFSWADVEIKQKLLK